MRKAMSSLTRLARVGIQAPDTVVPDTTTTAHPTGLTVERCPAQGSADFTAALQAAHPLATVAATRSPAAVSAAMAVGAAKAAAERAGVAAVSAAHTDQRAPRLAIEG